MKSLTSHCAVARSHYLALALFGLVLCAKNAAAFDQLVCVTTSAELQTALTNAETAGLPTVIEVAVGTYAIDSTLIYSGNASGLTIQGGYTGSLESGLCSGQSFNPALTILDGQQSTSIMNLQTFSTPLTVKYLTFQNGLSSSALNTAGALFAGKNGTDSGAIVVSDNVFKNNSQPAIAARIVELQTEADITLLDNAFVDNVLSTGDGIGIYSAGSGTVTAINNNTISGNVCSAPPPGNIAPGTAADFTTNASQMDLANNIVYGNVGCQQELLLNSASAQASFSLANNDFGTVYFPNSGGSPVSQVGDISVNPSFVAGGFTLAPSSALVNGGKNSPPGGVGTTDAAGNPRVVDTDIDIGAYELQDDIFKNGFQ